MSYKLGKEGQVQHIESGSWIPASYINGKVDIQDEHSSSVWAFVIWIERGGIPEPADPDPVPQPSKVERLTALLVSKGVLQAVDAVALDAPAEVVK